jgi:hypothetical protein
VPVGTAGWKSQPYTHRVMIAPEIFRIGIGLPERATQPSQCGQGGAFRAGRASSSLKPLHGLLRAPGGMLFDIVGHEKALGIAARAIIRSSGHNVPDDHEDDHHGHRNGDAVAAEVGHDSMLCLPSEEETEWVAFVLSLLSGFSIYRRSASRRCFHIGATSSRSRVKNPWGGYPLGLPKFGPDLGSGSPPP